MCLWVSVRVHVRVRVGVYKTVLVSADGLSVSGFSINLDSDSIQISMESV